MARREVAKRGIDAESAVTIPVDTVGIGRWPFVRAEIRTRPVLPGVGSGRGAPPSASRHSGRVEHRSGVSRIEDAVETFDDGF